MPETQKPSGRANGFLANNPFALCIFYLLTYFLEITEILAIFKNFEFPDKNNIWFKFI